jgi:protein TonB
MSATSMHRRKYPGSDPGRRTMGWMAVIALHVLIAWALVTGTARKALDIVKKPMEAAVIQEVIIPPPPPPPPPPPKEIVKPQAPKVEAPPPPFVPPPEVAPPPSAAPAITAVQTPPTAPPVIAPPPPAPAPPAPPTRANAAAVCQIVTPEMPRQAIREGTTGTVVAQAVIRGGKVTDIQLSGPRVFHSAIREAMSQYACNAAEGQLVSQEFVFKLE